MTATMFSLVLFSLVLFSLVLFSLVLFSLVLFSLVLFSLVLKSSVNLGIIAMKCPTPIIINYFSPLSSTATMTAHYHLCCAVKSHN